MSYLLTLVVGLFVGYLVACIVRRYRIRENYENGLAVGWMQCSTMVIRRIRQHRPQEAETLSRELLG